MNAMLQQNFARNLRNAIALRGLSQVACATEAGLTHPNLNRILQGKASPSLATCEALASAVGFEARELFLPPETFESLAHSHA
jgi:transcriptional regulator with XRE-family HTH domain